MTPSPQVVELAKIAHNNSPKQLYPTWEVMPDDVKEHWYIVAQGIINAGYTRTPKDVTLDAKNTHREGVDNVKQAERHDDVSELTFEQLKEVSRATKQAQRHDDVKWPEFKHVCGDYNGVSYREGWNACLEACKKAVGDRKDIGVEEILKVIRFKHTENMNLGFGARKTDEQMDSIIAQAIVDYLKGEGR